MIIETNSEKETYAFGLELGKKAHTGQVYTLVGDLGRWQDCFYKRSGKRPGYTGAGKQSDIYNCTGI